MVERLAGASPLGTVLGHDRDLLPLREAPAEGGS